MACRLISRSRSRSDLAIKLILEGYHILNISPDLIQTSSRRIQNLKHFKRHPLLSLHGLFIGANIFQFSDIWRLAHCTTKSCFPLSGVFAWLPVARITWPVLWGANCLYRWIELATFYWKYWCYPRYTQNCEKTFILTMQSVSTETSPLRWRHNDHDGVSNHQPHGCLLSRLFRRWSKKTSKLRVTGLCVGNSPGTDEFPAQMASNAEMFPFDDVIMLEHHKSQDLTKLLPGLDICHIEKPLCVFRCSFVNIYDWLNSFIM